MNADAEGTTDTYERDRELAHHKDPKVRRALAERQDVRPEILYFLAEDPSSEVRRTIAANEAAPRHADLLLARDSDEGVRTDIAHKITKLAPGLTDQEQDRVRRMIDEALEILARDQITRVRQILSETLKDVAHAPPEVIKRLAQDTEIVVAGPILEFSPVLTDEDLLEIIDSGPVAGGLGAIARRSQVNEGVADAIAITDDVEAIADLLSNSSAQIREEMLDRLIERAPSIELWHAPLVGRPKLPSHAASQLARFVADNLFETLKTRVDLDSETLDAVKSVVRHRLDEDRGGGEADSESYPLVDFLNTPPPIEVARRLRDAGRLDYNIISKALQASDYAFVLAALVINAGVSLKVGQEIFSARSAKGAVSLTWKATLPMKLAFLIQQRMARIPPGEVISPRDGKHYPLSEDEMNWQLEYFSDLCAKRGG